MDRILNYGNRFSRVATGQAGESGVYNTLDQYVSYGGNTYAYNARGQLVTKVDAAGTTTTYAYDSLGNLLEVDLPGGDVITYVVDAGGRRIERLKNSVVTNRWVYGGGVNPIAELDSQGRLLRR